MIWIVIIMATLFASLAGYREVQILIERGSWKWENYKKNWYWFTDQNNKKVSNRDSFHVSNGFAFVIVSVAFTLILFFALKLEWWWLLILPELFWIYMMQIRNLWMHKILKKKKL